MTRWFSRANNRFTSKKLYPGTWYAHAGARVLKCAPPSTASPFGRINLEPSQAPASKHKSPHSVRVTVRIRVRVGWYLLTYIKPPYICTYGPFRTICPIAFMVITHEKQHFFRRYNHKQFMLSARKKCTRVCHTKFKYYGTIHQQKKQRSAKIGQNRSNQSFSAKRLISHVFRVLEKNKKKTQPRMD